MTQQYSIFRPLAVCAMIACMATQAYARTPQTPASHDHSWVGEKGTASWYGPRYHGKRAANGSRFNQKSLTAAHPWLPFGTKVRVTLAGTGRSVVVVVTDRLHAGKRVIDLSQAAARALGMVSMGVARVSLAPA